MELIPFTLIELSEQKPTKTYFAEIQLHDNHLRYRVKFTGDEYIESSGTWKRDVGFYHDIVAKRDKVSAAELLFTNQQLWKVKISISGVAEDFNVFYNDFTEAKVLHEKLIKYITE